MASHHTIWTRHGSCALLLVVLQLAQGGCAYRDAAVVDSHQYDPPFSYSGDVPVPDLWWTAFQDVELNGQIQQAMQKNYTLVAAFERLRAARALTRREASDLWPDVDGFSEMNSTILTDGPNRSNYAFGVDVSYQVDLWGQIESRVEAQNFRATATQEDYYLIALTLSAEIASTYYSLIEARAQLELLDEQIETNQTGAELQEARFELGQIRSADLLRQRQLVQSTREQAVVVRARIEVLEHLLAVLQGLPPQLLYYETGSVLPDLPPLPSTGIPSELLNRRPDVRRDFFLIQAANQDLASAITSQYPRLNLFGTLTTAADNPDQIFRDWILLLGGQLIGPIFDGGERRAEVDRTDAIAQQRLAEYSQTVLIAYQEVEDALTFEHYQLERIERLNDQLELAHQSSIQLREQYLIGEVDYLDVLSAITGEQRLQREVLSSRLELILNRISLYLALAGGVDPCPVQLPVEVSSYTEIPVPIEVLEPVEALPIEVPIPSEVPLPPEIPLPVEIPSGSPAHE
ncbi:efflux transporter outer membrane subunit [Thalassoglobus sp. JC818]|uniref:TolC family protein n=1 Tax=Thalassoglobus sp. JC818 TaxID=3232136 RepID=UPI003457529A